MLDNTDEKSGAKATGKAGNKREKFVKLATARTKNAIKAIRIIGKLGNKNAYEYGDADVKRIASALSKEIDAMRARMSHSGGKEIVDFEL
jgi:ribosomal protein L7/L12